MFSKQLETEGVIVVRLFSDEEVKILQKEFDQQLLENPLIKDKVKYNEKPVMSSFGASGEPHPFHMPIQYKVNKRTHEWVKENLSEFATKRGFEKFFINRDRLMVRVPETTLSGETTHRDECPSHAHERGDVCLGGWLSISGTNKFSCVPKTHSSHNWKGGFAKIEKEEAKEWMKKMKIFEVPPGHAIMFFQDIIHCVKSGKVKERTTRIFQGITFTNSDDPWYSDLEETIRNRGVFKLPSGQTPFMYEKMHICNWGDRIDDFSKCFIDEVFTIQERKYNELLEKEKMKGKKGKKRITPLKKDRIPMMMYSLSEFSFFDKINQNYTPIEKEIEILFPSKI